MRPTIRCKHCNLNQFETKSGLCRRCLRLLPVQFQQPIELVDPPESRKEYKFDNALFVKAISFYRTNKGFKKSEIARQLHVSGAFVSKAESGFSRPTLATLERFAGVLDVPMGWLVSPVTDEKKAELFAVEVFQLSRSMRPQDKDYILRTVREVAINNKLRRTG